jgi:hypothetical protein
VPPEAALFRLGRFSVFVAVNDIRASFMVRLVSSFTNERRRNASGARGKLLFFELGEKQ